MMYLRRLFLILIGLLLTPTVSAHINKAALQRYKAAKKHYAASNYTAAQAVLAPLMKEEEKNDLSPYVLFYYALAAYHNEEPALAERTFTTLVEEFPAWEQQEEVWYWLGQLRLEAQDYTEGLAYLASITSQRLAKPVAQMKTYFLGQVDDLATLQTLLRLYPQDRTIAQVLFDRLVHQPVIRRDPELLHMLARDFNLIFKEQDLLQGLLSLKKDSYNVAVFLPFFVDEVDYEEATSNPLVITLYQGIKAAVAALAEQGIKINLFAYDTKKDPAITAGLLAQKEMKYMDLIIGPLHASTVPLVTAFARAHSINLFNPLSENAEVVDDNPFAFLFKPSLETQARKAVEFTLKNVPEETSIGIIYGTSAEDAIQANTYKQHIERMTGQEVALMLPLAPEKSLYFLHQLRGLVEAEDKEVPEEEHEELLRLTSLTHLYVASKDELIAANVLSAVEMLKINPHIIGYEAWLKNNALTLDQLQRLRLSLVAPDYIDYQRASIRDFRCHFYEQFAQYPTKWACIGYEMMLFLGHMLNQHGIYFQKHWAKQAYQGTVFSGVAYSTHHDNQQVPIVQLKRGKFVICNQSVMKD
ncbi:MAG: hypothetical protein AAF963_02915 [Bacteroidota bacterium]